MDKYELIRLVTDLLLSLYTEGWQPMTPIDTAVDRADRQTSICWRRREDVGNFRGSSLSLASVTSRGKHLHSQRRERERGGERKRERWGGKGNGESMKKCRTQYTAFVAKVAKI